MEKINIAKLLKDCPSGMKLNCTMYDNLYFDSVNADYYGTINCYTLIDGIKTSIGFTKYGTFNNHIGAKCVIYPKGKTTWEGFVPLGKFKDGDIVVTNLENVAIVRDEIVDNYYKTYCVFYSIDASIFTTGDSVDAKRLATEEEKQKLFNAIKKNGYKWNAETNTLKKLPKFKDGDIIFKNNFVTIVSYIEPEGIIWYHCWYNTKYKDCKFKNDCGIGNINDEDEIRFATEEEKEKLFRAIKDNGYHWNEETNNLEKLPRFKVGDRIQGYGNHINHPIRVVKSLECDRYRLDNGNYIKFGDEHAYKLLKFDITTLKPFDKVLVRGDVGQKWTHDFFGFMDKGFPFVSVGHYVKQCIPYEGNEHLLGTTEDCDYYYKNWE